MSSEYAALGVSRIREALCLDLTNQSQEPTLCQNQDVQGQGDEALHSTLSRLDNSIKPTSFSHSPNPRAQLPPLCSAAGRIVGTVTVKLVLGLPWHLTGCQALPGFLGLLQ